MKFKIQIKTLYCLDPITESENEIEFRTVPNIYLLSHEIYISLNLPIYLFKKRRRKKEWAICGGKEEWARKPKTEVKVWKKKEKCVISGLPSLSVKP